MKHIIVTLAAVFVIQQALGAEVEIPEIVKEGFTAYQKAGLKAAGEQWLKGSPLAKTVSPAKFQASMADTEETIGAYLGYEIVAVSTISPSIRRVYVAARYEKGFLMGRFTCYKGKEGWVITAFNFNPDPEVVLGTYYQERAADFMGKH